MIKAAIFKKMTLSVITLLVVTICLASCSETIDAGADVSNHSLFVSSDESVGCPLCASKKPNPMEEYLKGEEDIIRYIYDSTQICIPHPTTPAHLRSYSNLFMEQHNDLKQNYKIYPEPQQGDTITVYGEKYTVVGATGVPYHIGPYQMKFSAEVINENGETLVISYVDARLPPISVSYQPRYDREDVEDADIDMDIARQVALALVKEQYIEKYNMGADTDIEEYICQEFDYGHYGIFEWALYTEGVVKTKIRSFTVRVNSDYEIVSHGYVPYKNYKRFDEINQVPVEKYQELYTKMLEEIYVEASKIEFKQPIRPMDGVEYVKELGYDAFIISGECIVTYPDGEQYDEYVSFYVKLDNKAN